MVLCGIQVVLDLGSVGFVKKFNKRFVGRFSIGFTSGFVSILALLPVGLFLYKMVRGI